MGLAFCSLLLDFVSETTIPGSGYIKSTLILQIKKTHTKLFALLNVPEHAKEKTNFCTIQTIQFLHYSLLLIVNRFTTHIIRCADEKTVISASVHPLYDKGRTIIVYLHA
jgi:hypothetical protein